MPAPPNEPGVLLTNTVLRLLVDHTGRTISATLLTSSGLPKADQAALTFAAHAQFEAKPPEKNSAGDEITSTPTFGEMVFQWFPMRVPGTNQISPAPRP